jgi:protein arginine kinase activator
MTIPVHLCSKCETHPASVKVVKMQQGSAKQFWLCASCAMQESPYSSGGTLPNSPEPAKTLEDVLAGFLQKVGSEGAARPAQDVDSGCGSCGLPWEAYKTSLILGCPDCYHSFASALRTDLRKFHGAIQHQGRGPTRSTAGLERVVRGAIPGPDQELLDLSQGIEELRRQIQLAVDEEDYRRAAELKARMTELQARREEKQATLAKTSEESQNGSQE